LRIKINCLRENTSEIVKKPEVLITKCFEPNRCLLLCGAVLPARQIPTKLLTDAATLDDRTVTLDVVLEKVVEELSSLTDHLLHTSAGVVVLGVLLKVLGELADSLGEDSDLYLGRTGVAFVGSKFLNDVLLVFLCDHDASPFNKKYFRGELGKRRVKSGVSSVCP